MLNKSDIIEPGVMAPIENFEKRRRMFYVHAFAGRDIPGLYQFGLAGFPARGGVACDARRSGRFGVVRGRGHDHYLDRHRIVQSAFGQAHKPVRGGKGYLYKRFNDGGRAAWVFGFGFVLADMSLGCSLRFGRGRGGRGAQ